MAAAVTQFKEASLLRPDDPRIREELAAAQIAAGHLTEGVRNIESLARQPEHADRRDLQYTLAAAYVQAHRPGDAKRVYLELTREDPTDAQAWIRLGEVSWALRDVPGTLLAAKRATVAAYGLGGR